MTEVEPSLMTLLMQRVFLPADQRDEKAAQQAAEKLKAPLKVLDDQLAKGEYLLGKDFTMADLNVAAVLSFAQLAKVDLSATPKTKAWLEKCLGREANQRVRKMA
jgi:glutathione S-transferase